MRVYDIQTAAVITCMLGRQVKRPAASVSLDPIVLSHLSTPLSSHTRSASTSTALVRLTSKHENEGPRLPLIWSYLPKRLKSLLLSYVLSFWFGDGNANFFTVGRTKNILFIPTRLPLLNNALQAALECRTINRKKLAWLLVRFSCA